MTEVCVGYFGDGPWSHRALEKLLADSSTRVAFVCARSDRPDPVLRAMAEKEGIVFLTHGRVNSVEFLELIDHYRCDLFISMSFNQVFRARLLEHPRLGTINCHAGKLPFYRGRNVLNWALINDEREFGITVHFMDEGIDTGDIIMQRLYPISDEDDYGTLLKCAYAGCADLLYETVKRLQTGTATRTTQDSLSRFGSYGTMRVAGDERMNWHQTSRDVFNFVRAICRPGPEARTLRGEMEIKINRVEFLPLAPIFKGIPGAVVGIELNGFLVKTIDSYVKVVEWSGVDRVAIGDRLT